MDKKIFINYIYNILYQIVKLVLPFFLVPYTMGHLGESVLGISDFAGNIANWFILFGILGVNTYGIREIGKVRDNKEELSKNFFEILIMQLTNMLIALILFFLYSKIIVKNNQIIYYLYCFTLISSAIDISWFYYGIEDFKIVSIRNTVVKFIGVLLIFTFVKSPSDLWKFVLINSGTDMIGQALTYLGLRKHISFTKVRILDAYKHHLVATFILFVPTIAINVYTLLDQTMLGVLIEDKGNVALYKTSQSFVKMFLYFITSIGAVVMPRIANVFAKSKDKDEVNKYINQTFNLAIILSIPMMIAMFTVSPFYFPWYLPNQYEQMIKLVQVACPVIVFISISNVFGTQYLVPTNRTKEYTTSVIVGAVVNVCVNLFTIPRFQAVGAAIGNACAELTVTAVQWFFVRNDIKLHSLKTFIKSLISAIVMGVVVTLVGNIVGSSIVGNLIQAICGGLTYAILMLVLKEETVTGVFNKYILRKPN